MTGSIKQKIARETKRIGVMKQGDDLTLGFIGVENGKAYFIHEISHTRTTPGMECIADLLIKHEQELNDICKIKGREYRDFFSLIDAFDFRELWQRDFFRGFQIVFGE